MRSLLFVLLVACGGSKSSTTVANPPPPPPTGSGAGSSQPMVAAPLTRPTCDKAEMQCAVTTFAYFTDQACACKDTECATKVTNEMTVWGTEMAQGPLKDKKPDPATTKQMTDLAEKYGACMQKIYSGSTPPADPCGGGANPCGD